MIYLDNAASTHAKPPAVAAAVCGYLSDYASNSGRSGHKLSIYTGEKIYECRELLARLFNIDDPSRIAFTQNATFAINFAVHGLVSKGSHVVISGMEHNAVVRPVVASGADYTVAKADKNGFVSPQSVEAALRSDTALIIINHASNIVGTINPITEIGKIAARHNIPLLVDAAQTAGVLDIDVKRDNISLLAFAGHKLLFGPSGTGGLYVREGIKLKTIIQGGTGTLSESVYQPDFMPDALESGTLNAAGIIGLAQGVKYVLNKGTDVIYAHERYLAEMLRTGLSRDKRVTLYGGGESVGVVGFNIAGMDSVSVSNELDRRFDIASRGGLHCAVLAHKSIGTESTGLVRLSVSDFNTEDEIKQAVAAVWSL